MTRQLKSLIRTVEIQITDLEKAIARHLQSDDKIAEKVSHVCTIKGVAQTTLAVLLGETNGFY